LSALRLLGSDASRRGGLAAVDAPAIALAHLACRRDERCLASASRITGLRGDCDTAPGSATHAFCTCRRSIRRGFLRNTGDAKPCNGNAASANLMSGAHAAPIEGRDMTDTDAQQALGRNSSERLAARLLSNSANPMRQRAYRQPLARPHALAPDEWHSRLDRGLHLRLAFVGATLGDRPPAASRNWNRRPRLRVAAYTPGGYAVNPSPGPNGIRACAAIKRA
jgi:hypothetical protein